MQGDIYNLVLGILWIGFILYWAVSARSVKKDAYRQGGWWRSVIVISLIAIIIENIYPTLQRPIFPQSATVGLIAVIVAALGIALAVWARVHLGANWSSRPAVKEGHELVTSGPYRFVRHPIYTGIILAFLGTALIDSFVWAVLFFYIIVVFVLRVHKEESLMTQQFPQEYPEYKKHTKALVPFIW